MIAFLAAVFFLMITPGPGVLSVAGVGTAFGFQAGARYIVGLFIGTNMVALAVVTGLAGLILANPAIRTVLAILSASYLIYLAYRIATAGGNIAIKRATRAPGIRDGIALQMINPKAYVVNTTLFSSFVIWPNAMGTEIFAKFIMVNAIWLPIHFLWLWFGISIRRLDLAEATQTKINIAMAVALLIVVGLALRSIVTA